jgi:hypothetical protein
MTIEHVLEVVPVSDVERASGWYEALFGRPADNRPMTTLVEWQVVTGGWVQVFHDPDRAGSGLLNLRSMTFRPLGTNSPAAVSSPARSSR